ncbi:hypothetical protein [Accumulibacter sp.]|uniref:hypothetical protein n=1 Tax=Accumulibacter sp. TaxID=2053492 RepID=UPI0025E8B741|nr:hypothetical protein [Accumulibacter sp.]MCM8593880.1 hypothetical protein [Accumulibacter sp.]MCM8626078.1 hypothetical protein [Accumulibacter sp.]MDS4048021.1 hypothetical protein [Accumulibacter sp.]
MFRKQSFCLLLVSGLLSATAAAEGLSEPSRVAAALAQGRAAELGYAGRHDPLRAIARYCDAAMLGSAEGFFRVGRILARGPRELRNPALANTYLALAARLGSQRALDYYDPRVDQAALGKGCRVVARGTAGPRFEADSPRTGLLAGNDEYAGLTGDIARP